MIGDIVSWQAFLLHCLLQGSILGLTLFFMASRQGIYEQA